MRTTSFVWNFPASDASSNSTATFYDDRGLSESTGSTVHTGTLGSTAGYTLSTGLTRTVTFTQPVRAVRPRIVALSSGGIRISLQGQGSW
jgi:hypothetical protein